MSCDQDKYLTAESNSSTWYHSLLALRLMLAALRSHWIKIASLQTESRMVMQ